MNGNTSGLPWAANGANLPAAELACGGPSGSASAIWFPDLRRDESLVDIDIMVKF